MPDDDGCDDFVNDGGDGDGGGEDAGDVYVDDGGRDDGGEEEGGVDDDSAFESDKSDDQEVDQTLSIWLQIKFTSNIFFLNQFAPITHKIFMRK